MARLNYYSIFSFSCCHKLDKDSVAMAYHTILDYLDESSVCGAFCTEYQAKKYGFYNNIIYIYCPDTLIGRFYSVPDEEYHYLKDFYSYSKHVKFSWITIHDFLACFRLRVSSKPSHFDINFPSVSPSPLPDLVDSDLPF